MTRRLRIMHRTALALILLTALVLAGCTYLFPVGGWDTSSPTTPAPQQGSPRPAGLPLPTTDDQIHQARQQMFQILQKVNSQHAVRVGRTLKLRYLPTGQLQQSDPWGTPYCLLPVIPAQTNPGLVKARFWLISAGPDQQFGTADDIRLPSAALRLERPRTKN